MHFFSAIAASAALAGVANALGSSLKEVTDFKAGPTKAGMYVYIQPHSSNLHPLFWQSTTAPEPLKSTSLEATMQVLQTHTASLSSTPTRLHLEAAGCRIDHVPDPRQGW